MQKDSPFEFSLWGFVALAPLLMIAASFFFGVWTWGFIDDHALVYNYANRESLGDLIMTCFRGGRGFRITYNLYEYYVYPLFFGNPHAFYLARAALVAVTLGLWGWCAALLTGRRLALAVLPVVALGTLSFYDGIFFLSVQEVLGLFFLGIFSVGVVRGILVPARQGRPYLPAFIAFAIVSLPFVVFAKEFFCTTVMLMSVGLAAWGWSKKRPGVMWSAIVLFITLAAYLLWILLFIKGGDYTGNYNPTDLAKLRIEMGHWMKLVLPWHAPWLAFLGGLWIWKRTAMSRIVRENRGALLTAVAIYFGYLVIILPWGAHGYMTIPLAVYFGMIVTILFAPLVDELTVGVRLGAAAICLVVNMMVAGFSLNSFAIYNYDNSNVLEWMKNDQLFQVSMKAGKKVGCNAFEPAYAFTHLSRSLNGQNFTVEVEPNVGNVIRDSNMLFYVYGPNFGDQDLSRLPGMWSKVFVSRNWIIFRRNF